MWQMFLFFLCILFTCCGASQEICKVYIQSNRQNNFQQKFLSFWLSCIKPAILLLTQSAVYVPHVHVCVYVCLLKINWGESYWKSFTDLCCWQSLEQQSHGKISCQQAGREGNCFLTCMNQKEVFFPSLHIPNQLCLFLHSR